MKKTILLFLSSLIFTGLSFAQETNPKTALVLIDIQAFYFDTTKAPLTGRFEATEKASAILQHFRKEELEIVHVMHKGGGEIHELVRPAPGELVIVKEEVSCFRDTPLLDSLQTREVERLVIVGMMTHMCVEAATRSADDLGFEAVLIHDACATRDLKFGDEVVEAREVHLSTLSTLGAYARIMSAEEYLAE